MTTQQTTKEVAELLSAGPQTCRDFLEANFPAKFNWLRLAEGAATEAAMYTVLGHSPLQLGLEWIRVAVEVYERMADHPNMDFAARVRLTEPAIAKRAQALAIWGVNKSDPILDPEELVARFKSIVRAPAEQLHTGAELPHTADKRTVLLLTRFLTPLLHVEEMKSSLSEVAEYCDLAASESALEVGPVLQSR